MSRIAKSLVALALAAPLAAQLSPPAAAEPLTPRVLVPPTPLPYPEPAGYAGTWRLQGLLYDRFQLSVSLNQYGGGSYTARIGYWETCTGSLAWSQTSGNAMTVRLARSYCNGPSGTWSADRMICRPAGGYFSAGYGDGYGYGRVGGRVADPGPSGGQRIACTYLPGSGYYQPAYVSLTRW